MHSMNVAFEPSQKFTFSAINISNMLTSSKRDIIIDLCTALHLINTFKHRSIFAIYNCSLQCIEYSNPMMMASCSTALRKAAFSVTSLKITNSFQNRSISNPLCKFLFIQACFLCTTLNSSMPS